MNETVERLDRDTIDYIMNEFRKDAVFVTAPELNAAIANFAKLVTSGKLHTPNRSGGANGPEVIAKIDAAIGTDWKSGTAPEILAVIEAAGDVTLTGIGTATNLAANANAPGTNTAGIALIGQKDSSVGTAATLDIETEEVVVAIGTFTESHKIAVWINNVEYHISLDAV